MPVLIIAMAVPNAVFYYLATVLPQDLLHIGLAVAVEMAGYGFGFVGMILFIMQAVAPGDSNGALRAGLSVMQLGFIFQTISGDIQMHLGYADFFLWTILCGIPALVLMAFVSSRQTAPVSQP